MGCTAIWVHCLTAVAWSTKNCATRIRRKLGKERWRGDTVRRQCRHDTLATRDCDVPPRHTDNPQRQAARGGATQCCGAAACGTAMPITIHDSRAEWTRVAMQLMHAASVHALAQSCKLIHADMQTRSQPPTSHMHGCRATAARQAAHLASGHQRRHHHLPLPKPSPRFPMLV